MPESAAEPWTDTEAGTEAVLARLSRVRFSVTTGHAGIVLAGVQAHRSGSAVVIEEKGRTTVRGRSIATWNMARWSRRGHAIELEHLRFGPERPVFLARLTLGAEGFWQAHRPHLCGQDRYTPDLRLADGSIVIRWRITGPDGEQFIQTVYSDEPAAPPSPPATPHP